MPWISVCENCGSADNLHCDEALAGELLTLDRTRCGSEWCRGEEVRTEKLEEGEDTGHCATCQRTFHIDCLLVYAGEFACVSCVDHDLER